MPEFITTLNKIRACDPCQEGWMKLLKHLGKTQADDDPLPFSTILDSNGLDDALWCCRSAPEYAKEWRLFAVWCARKVQHLMTDHRSIDAIDIAEKHANGLATNVELAAAWSAARSAVRSAVSDAARAAAWSAAWSAARSAVSDEASDEARSAARSEAWSAASYAAWSAARPEARSEAWSAVRSAQQVEFLRVVTQSR